MMDSWKERQGFCVWMKTSGQNSPGGEVRLSGESFGGERRSATLSRKAM
jgi:hypothetical protein